MAKRRHISRSMAQEDEVRRGRREPEGMPASRTYGYGDPIHVSTQQIWLVLTAFVYHCRRGPSKIPGKITYGEVVDAMGLSPLAGRTISRQLGVIANFCKANDLPLLNTIVVRKNDGQPGDGVIKSDNLKRDQKRVLAFDWWHVRVPTTGEFRRAREAGEK